MTTAATTKLLSGLSRIGQSQSVRWWLLVAITVTLPFTMLFNSFLIILLAAHWLLEGRFREKLQRLRQQPLALAWMAFYVLHLFGMLYTNDLGRGKGDLEAKMATFVLPLLLASVPPLARQQVRRLTYLFVGSCTLGILYALGRAALAYLDDGNTDHFFYHQLSGFMGIHGIYLAIYVSFCLFVPADFLIRHRGEGPSRLKWVAGLLMLLFTAVIILLSSKMMILLAVVYLNVFLVLYATKGRRRYVFGAVVGVNVLFGAALLSLPFVRERFHNALHSDYFDYKRQGDYEFYYTGVSLRVAIWRVCIDIVREQRAWLWGVGTGDGQPLLDEKYHAYGFYTGDAAGIDHGILGYNAHNQYMQFLLSVGLLGLGGFLALLVLPVRVAVRSGHHLLVMLLVLLAVSSLTESVLCRQKGVVFFMLFYCLYTFHSASKPSIAPGRSHL
ncbi:MAG: O-antigen ligase family protein [Cytophagales bacterium]|nr:O-antigen ligase family protein [Cytophagales bacterium]